MNDLSDRLAMMQHTAQYAEVVDFKQWDQFTARMLLSIVGNLLCHSLGSYSVYQ